MATKTIQSTNAQFKRDLKAGRAALDKSHIQLVWAFDNAIEEQDLTQLDTMYAMVAEAWPALKTRYSDYIVASLDNVKFKSGKFDDDGQLFDKSAQCVLGTAWNTRDRLAKTDNTPKVVDPRAELKRTVNKLAKRGMVAAFDGDASQHVADVLAKALADMEAIAAGTYGKKAKRVATSGNVVGIKAA